jgi:RNase H-like domain found in reverse transcriptase
MTLAFLDPDKRICVSTDASNRFYAFLVTQMHEEQLELSMGEHDHQPLAFLPGEFKGAQQRWTVPEKEVFAIVDTVAKMDYLLLSHDEFSILSDHLHLTYIYNSLSAYPTLARHVVQKLQRWALKMSIFSYRMEHDMGKLNYWKDLMTIRGLGLITGREHKAHGKMDSLFAQLYINPPDYDTVEFPSKQEIVLAQQSAVNEYEQYQKSNATDREEVPPQQVDAGGMRMMSNVIWIPERAVELQLRLCVEEQCRSAGHRAYEATLGAINKYTVWITMAQDVKVFVQNSLHCVAILQTKCHARWIRSYMRPSPTRSCTSTFLILGCQEMESISTCYFSRIPEHIPMACAVSHG